MNYRSRKRDVVDWIVTAILVQVTLSATIDCRRQIAHHLRKWVMGVWLAGFAVGCAAGVIGLVVGMWLMMRA